MLAIPVAALCIALMRTGPQVVFAGFTTLFVTIVGIAVSSETFTERVGVWRDGAALAQEDLKQILPEEIAYHISRSDPLALVGEARAFWYPLDSRKLRYRTVFDVDVKPGETVVQAWLGDSVDPAAYVVVDPNELDRFSRTYFGIPPLPPDLSGPRDRSFVMPPATPAPPATQPAH